MTKNFKNILIVRTDRIGDVILTTPAIKALRDAYPDALIDILVTPSTKELVEGNACIDHVLIDDRHHEHKGLFGFIKIVQQLRRKNYDCAIVYHTKKRTNAMCFLAGIPFRLGYKNNKFGFLLNHPLEDRRHTGQQHEAQYCLDVLKVLGIESNSLSLYLPVGSQSIQWADEFLNKENIGKEDCIIAIHPGASDPAKQWSINRFAELIDQLIEKYSAKIILIGSPEVQNIARKIISVVHGKVIDLTGQTSVGQLAGLMTRCNLLVSNDSGPVHIAAGVGTPVISIFTRNQPGINPERWRPLIDQSRVVSIDLSQNTNISFKKAQTLTLGYSELIATNEVLEAVDSLFKLC